jgi:hypothetical protein
VYIYIYIYAKGIRDNTLFLKENVLGLSLK